MISSVLDRLNSVLDTLDPGEESIRGQRGPGFNRTDRGCWLGTGPRLAIRSDDRLSLGPVQVDGLDESGILQSTQRVALVVLVVLAVLAVVALLVLAVLVP